MKVHYTCADWIGLILRDRQVTPAPQPVLGNALLSWWTDITWSTSKESLGLTSHLLTCDRMEHRVRCSDESLLTWWPEWAHHLPREVRDLLEVPGTMPAHWWVASAPVPIETVTP